MVFFTAVLIVVILYYLQADGLIYVTIIAVAGELVNIFMTQTMGKAVEKKTAVKFSKLVQGYQTKMAAQKKTIKELENIQEESVHKLYKANKKIKEYQSKLGTAPDQKAPEPAVRETAAPQQGETHKQSPIKENTRDDKGFDDLPDGSNRKKLPI